MEVAARCKWKGEAAAVEVGGRALTPLDQPEGATGGPRAAVRKAPAPMMPATTFTLQPDVEVDGLSKTVAVMYGGLLTSAFHCNLQQHPLQQHAQHLQHPRRPRKQARPLSCG